MLRQSYVPVRQMRSAAVLAILAASVCSLAGCMAQANPISESQAAINADCSRQADAQNLHGDARWNFRAKCKMRAAPQ